MPHFQFTESFGDARVEELKLLSWSGQHEELTFEVVPSGPWLDLLLWLVSSDLLSVFSFDWAQTTFGKSHDQASDLAASSGIVGESPFERAVVSAKVRAIFDLYSGRPPAGLRLTHQGRLRLSELRQRLRSGRQREPFGILWDTRHWEQDVQIAVLDAFEESPLSLAYLDMNGLKVINDRHGHDAGDLALKAYFQTVVSALGDRGEAYRLGDKADEVLAVLPNCKLDRAVQLMRVACTRLMEERLWPTDPEALLSIAAGVTSTTDPMASPRKLRAAADVLQKTAKERSKATTPRPSVIAVGDEPDLIVISHTDADFFPVLIEPSYFQGERYEKGIQFTVTNLGREALPPFRIGLFHPKQGHHFFFPSEKSGPLLQDQKRKFSCSIVENGRVPEWFPKLTHGGDGEPLTPEDDSDFEFRFVLEDSDKVLFCSKRIGRCLAMLLRRTVQNGIEVDIQSSDWTELRYQPSPG